MRCLLAVAVLVLGALLPAARPWAGGPSHARKSQLAPRASVRRLLPARAYRRALDGAIHALHRDKGRGIVRLRPDLRTVVLPDLHARANYLERVLQRRDPQTRRTYFELLRSGDIQVVLLGDAMHAESRAAERWARAAADPGGPEMRQEARESLGTMKLIMDLKRAYPGRFHYMKGNHDNISDRRGGGDWPVGKYAAEGRLMRDYLTHRFGKGFVERWRRFESLLPIVAVGNGFALAHAGPARALRPATIDRRSATAVANFTWTDLTSDSARQAATADRQLEQLGIKGGFFLAGHRPARRVRKQGRFFQLNNEDRMYFAVLEPGKPFNMSRDVLDAKPPAVEPPR